MSRPYRPTAAIAWPTALSPTRLRLARVHGRSMLPTLHEGDLLLVDRGVPVRPGVVVVAALPDGTLAVKRVAHREAAGWWLERDNPAEGVDSWLVGAVADGDVVGVARARLWPRPGRLAGAGPAAPPRPSPG